MQLQRSTAPNGFRHTYSHADRAVPPSTANVELPALDEDGIAQLNQHQCGKYVVSICHELIVFTIQDTPTRLDARCDDWCRCLPKPKLLALPPPPEPKHVAKSNHQWHQQRECVTTRLLLAECRRLQLGCPCWRRLGCCQRSC